MRKGFRDVFSEVAAQCDEEKPGVITRPDVERMIEEAFSSYNKQLPEIIRQHKITGRM